MDVTIAADVVVERGSRGVGRDSVAMAPEA
jgi:hypothetical protein